MKKFIIFTISFCSFVGLDFAISNILYDQDSYLKGYTIFYNASKDSKGQKRIILLGGSSLGWGVSARTISDETGILTLNSGVHAGVGFKGFYELAANVLDIEHDLIVISPEYSIPSNSSLRNPEFCSIAQGYLHKYYLECLGFSINRIFRTIPTLRMNHGDYMFSGFNDVGDYIFRGNKRDDFIIEENQVCKKINIEKLQSSYLPYYSQLKKDGFNVVYIPNVVPVSGCTQTELLDEFNKIVFKKFGISGYEDQKIILEDRYFYNSAGHLTREGVKVKTKIFTKQIKSYIDSTNF